MANTVIPYSFTPGTKAKAQEVNANFNALAQKIDENNSTTVHTNSNINLTGELSFSSSIYSTSKLHDTKGNLTIKPLADEEFSDAILGINDTDTNCASIRIKNNNGSNEISMNAYSEDGTSTSSLGLKNTDGISYAYAPTYKEDYSDISNKIVTTEYLANHWTTQEASTTSTATNAQPTVVIENYKNETSWYRVWSDGWIEQGGHLNYTSSFVATITFAKPYTKTDYIFCGSILQPSNTNGGWGVLVKTRTTTDITIQRVHGSGQTNTKDVIWYSCGY